MPPWAILLAAALPAAPLAGTELATAGNAQTKWASAGGWTYLALVVPRGGVDAVAVYRSTDRARWALDAVLSRPGVRAALPALAASEDGAVHAVWVDYAGPGHVWYARRGPGGWSAGRKLSPGALYAGFPAAAGGPGGLHVLWYGVQPSRLTPHGAVYEIVHTRWASAGWSAPRVISPGVPDALNPSAARLGDSLHAAWYQSDGRSYRVHHAEWSRGRWTPPEFVSPEGATATAAALAASSRGLHAVWQQHEGTTSRVVYRHRPPAGPWSPPVVLGEGTDPVVAAAATTTWVAWAAGGSVRVRALAGGSWGHTWTAGEGSHPALDPSGSGWLAYTRRSAGAYEVVVTGLQRPSPAWPRGWWLLFLPAAYLLARALLARRARPIHGGNPP